jgi:hypothetical protein
LGRTDRGPGGGDAELRPPAAVGSLRGTSGQARGRAARTRGQGGTRGGPAEPATGVPPALRGPPVGRDDLAA